MRDYMLSLLIWIVLPLILIAFNVIFSWNILFLIWEMVWLGFGIFVIGVNDED